MTRLVVDTHLHVYPWYDLGALFSSLSENLAALDAGALPGAVLTERVDCSLFRDLRDETVTPPSPWRVERTAEEEALALLGPGELRILLFAGRQVVTGERLEILSLLADPRDLDGRDAAAVIGGVTRAGGVPVLAWAPGKWFFGRGKTVAALTGRLAAGEILMGDTTLRPTLWGEPRLMAAARRKGISVAAGSDPLPITGEERYAGSYATILEGAFDGERPVRSLRSLFRTPRAVKVPAGRRGGTAETVARLARNALSKR